MFKIIGWIIGLGLALLLASWVTTETTWQGIMIGTALGIGLAWVGIDVGRYIDEHR